VVALALLDPGLPIVITWPFPSRACSVDVLVVVAIRVSTTPRETVPPAGMLPRLHITAVFVMHVPWLGMAESMVALAVNESVTITWATVALPLFVTMIWYPTSVLAVATVGPLIVTARLATPGAGGAVGVTALEGAEFALSPMALVARTTKV
jgi:hypothetical protein